MKPRPLVRHPGSDSLRHGLLETQGVPAIAETDHQDDNPGVITGEQVRQLLQHLVSVPGEATGVDGARPASCSLQGARKLNGIGHVHGRARPGGVGIADTQDRRRRSGEGRERAAMEATQQAEPPFEEDERNQQAQHACQDPLPEAAPGGGCQQRQSPDESPCPPGVRLSGMEPSTTQWLTR